jgi:hypothetical protein
MRFIVGLFAMFSAAQVLHQAPAWAEDRMGVTYADRLFLEGVQLMKVDDCPHAIPKFLSSDQLDPSAATLVNLATCYARIGRSASAWHKYRKAAEVAANEKNDALREQALKGAAILSPTLTRLRIVAPSDASSLSMTLNGEPLTPDEDLTVPLDPGDSIVEISAPGRKPWHRTVTAAEVGATIVIEVPELAPAQQELRKADVPAPVDSWNGAKTAAVALAGLGVVAGTTAVVEWIRFENKKTDAENACPSRSCLNPQYGFAQSYRSEEKTARTVAVVAGIVGAASLAGAAVVWLTSARTSNETKSLRVLPFGGQRALGIEMGATW